MDIDKAVNAAPAGLSVVDNDPEFELEIIIEGEEEEGEIDGINKEEEDFNINLAEDMDDDVLTELATELVSDYVGCITRC